MPVEFLGIAGTNPASEVTPRTGGALDLEYTAKLARAHEDNGWDRILFAYHSGSPDPSQVAAYVAGKTERINLVVAHRPNVAYPTLTAKTFATLDHLSGGRFEVHVITGGSTADQAAEGDFLAKDDRYGRTREFIQILKQAWTSAERFDFAGSTTSSSSSWPTSSLCSNRGRGSRSVGRQRPPTRSGRPRRTSSRCGVSRWPVRRNSSPPSTPRRPRPAVRTGRSSRSRSDRSWHRPRSLAWAKAESILGRIKDVQAGGGVGKGRLRDARRTPENAGSQRLLKAVEAGERHDRALWTAPTGLTGGGGNSTALVGTPETVAAALLDYYDLGVRIFRPRLRHLRRRHRLRPLRDPAGPRGSRPA